MATSFQILAAWLPFISPSDLEQSFQYFQQGNPVNGYISGMETTTFTVSREASLYLSLSLPLVGSTVGNILSRSGLPQDSLSHIWSLSNISNSPLGLSLPEFALSWHLVKLVLNGTILPPVLPDNFKTMLVAAVNNSNSGQQQYQQQQLLQPISTGNTSYSSSSSSGSAFSATSPLAKSINPNQPPLQQQQQQYFSSYNSTAPSSLMQAASSKSSTSSKWAITPAEKSQSDSIFKIWDPNNVGFVDGERARNIFGSSGLSDAMLAHIW